jgi:peptide deformylase
VTVMTIKTLGEPVLRTPARPVERFDSGLARIADDMFETMEAAPGVGLAAPQVGISLRFFVYDDGDGHRGFVANPSLSGLEDPETKEEGCLSIPGPFHPAARATRTELNGHGLDGASIEIRAEGLLARIFQHETDHLDGILYIDRLDEEGRRDVLRQLREIELQGKT